MNISLPNSLQAWSLNRTKADCNRAFKAVFIKEVEALNGHDLPLQEGLRWSSYAVAEGFRVMVIAIHETAESIEVKTGVFYKGIIAGCSCSDDPSPTDEQTEYCDMLFTLHKPSANAVVKVIQD